MEGELDKLVSEQGSGTVSVERITGREPLGSWPGARTRAQFWLHLPRPEGKLRWALLTVGLEAAGAQRSLRLRIALDRASVTREFKPQFAARLDETVYLKAVYDVTPILRKRLGRGDLHRLQIFYDLAQPAYFRDATLIAAFEADAARYAVSALTGARVLEPGEVTVEYPPFYRSFGGERRASLTIHSPYHEASFEVVVAGRRAGPLQGAGSFPVELGFDYEGSLVPVSVRYNDPGYKFYPRRAVVTDVVLEEVLLPRVGLALEVATATIEGDTLRIEAVVRNESEVPVRGILIALLALGGQLASKRIGRLMPGEEERVTLRASLSRLPLRPQSVVLTLAGYAMGRRVEKSLEVGLS